MNPRAEPGCVRELFVSSRQSSIIQYTGLLTKDHSRGGHDSVGAHLWSHQTFQESAKRSPFTIDRSMKSQWGMGPSHAPGGTPVKAKLDELEDKQATGQMDDC